MNTFTAERSYLPLFRCLLPKTRPPSQPASLSPQDSTSEPAALPGQNTLEVYGAALLTLIFTVVWWSDLLHSFLLGLPAALLWIHLSALLGALAGSWIARHFSSPSLQSYVWPQRLQWGLLTLMSLAAIAWPLPAARWISWPLLLFLGANLLAWCLTHRPGGLFVLAHILSIALWPLAGWPAALLGLFLTHSVMLTDILSPRATLFTPRIRRFPTQKNEVWLTIDDGPSHDTQAILDLLDRFQARATFFLIGRHAQARPQDVQAITRHGHSVGNHTFTHPAGRFWILPWRSLESEIQRNQTLLTQLTGSPPTLFRGPVGFSNACLPPLLRQFNLTFLSWSARALDGVDPHPGRALKRLQRQIRPGSIIVIHQGRPGSLELLHHLLTWLQDQGIRCTLPNPFENEASRLS